MHGSEYLRILPIISVEINAGDCDKCVESGFFFLSESVKNFLPHEMDLGLQDRIYAQLTFANSTSFDVFDTSKNGARYHLCYHIGNGIIISLINSLVPASN